MQATRTHALVLGGIRSGKSALAEQRATASGGPVTYIATATAGDGEMSERIRRHRQRRPADWGLVECPLALGAELTAQAQAGAPCLLIDCMSLWLSNLLHAGDEVFQREQAEFVDAVAAYPGSLVIVSNEVGLGTIGMDPLTRRFCDELGWLNQALAASCDQVVLTVAGLPMVLKGE
ncbi:bifunctional adenosylcobinamide kinase/adenosylcobinamide-phosphate guanylyltransferase [Marinobacter xestospongiae]|uniref:bifunctional adenosylcobinamide kinase/adenosylcobinamide-phosphate guanylyltransferase n=1 Tax=Marinobacter xestospongiae TaxID=994319 RepID=UPI002004BD2D|nr:bifunctional adenosylcobinamide kinase/adenosylcobinamide-phosphate guanylyltransferase [Marinobacter xestospongiae]MCK7566334.1 bifunctional adenosylcobinamide kinase/adenosylcobinamide-phosphate guanylyltransferase [Marinobacter xestospongiae]